LNQSRIRAWGRSSDHSEILIVGRAADRVRWGELSSVEDVKELSAELKTKPLVSRESRSFEHRNVKITNPVGAQPRIHTLLVPKSKVSWRRKTGCIKPSWDV
jgi:hypothetical protein